MTAWRWRRHRTVSERLHGLRGVVVRLLGRHCGKASPARSRLGLCCDKRAGHRDGACEDRAWIGGFK